MVWLMNEPEYDGEGKLLKNLIIPNTSIDNANHDISLGIYQRLF